MTNILLLPEIEMQVLTGNNEDWIDVLLFLDELGNQVSLSAISFEMEIRRHVTDHEVLLKATSGNGEILVMGLGQGVMQITVPAASMQPIPDGNYVMDMLAYAEGYQRRIVSGAPVVVFQGVTQIAEAGARETPPPSNILVLPMIDMEIIQANNDDWLLTLVYNDLNGVPLSLADMAFDFHMRQTPRAKDIVVSASTADGRMTVTPDNKLNIVVPASAFSMTWPGNYVGDILATSFGYRRIVSRMAFTFTEGVTR